MWTEQINALEKQVAYLAFDIRGFGESDLGDRKVSIDLYCEDLFALMDLLKIPKAILCGLSMGGYIALRFRQRFPERVVGMILADTRTGEDSDEAKEKRKKGIDQLRAGGIDEFADNFLKGALSPQTLSQNSGLFASLRASISKNAVEGMCAALAAMANRKDTAIALSSNPISTLLIVGEEDKLTPPAEAEKMAQLHGKAVVEKIPNAGHLSNLEMPKVFNEKLEKFLKR